MALSLDLPAIVERNVSGSASHADSPQIPGLAAYRIDTHSGSRDDIERAQLLTASVAANQAIADADAGDDADDADSAEETTDGFTILVEDVAPLTNLARDIAEGWGSLGIRVDVEPLPIDQLEDRLQIGAFESAIVTQHIGSDPDLYRFWHPAQSAPGLNYGGA